MKRSEVVWTATGQMMGEVLREAKAAGRTLGSVWESGGAIFAAAGKNPAWKVPNREIGKKAVELMVLG